MTPAVTIAGMVLSAGLGCLASSLLLRWQARSLVDGPRAADGWQALAGLLGAAGTLLIHHWLLAALNAAAGAWFGWRWWHHRRPRGRRRAPRAYGAKSAARITALARRARRAGQPRPVRQPDRIPA